MRIDVPMLVLHGATSVLCDARAWIIMQWKRGSDAALNLEQSICLIKESSLTWIEHVTV